MVTPHHPPSRYGVFIDYIMEVIEMLRAAVGEERTNHLVSMEGVVEQCLGHTTVPPRETVFYAPFVNLTGVEGELVGILLLSSSSSPPR